MCPLCAFPATALIRMSFRMHCQRSKKWFPLFSLFLYNSPIGFQYIHNYDKSKQAIFTPDLSNYYIKNLFGDKHSIEKHLSFSLQFSSLSEEQVQSMQENKSLPYHISKYIEGFDGALTEEEFNNPRFAYRVLKYGTADFY